jgi:hypothetical protein
VFVPRASVPSFSQVIPQMDDEEDLKLEILKLKSEIDSVREVIKPLLIDLEERRATYTMLTGRLN